MRNLIILLLLLVCSCCATKNVVETEYKEVPVLVHDTLIQKLFSHDTTIVKDSIIILQKGDTIFYTKYKDIYKTKWLKDTVTKIVEKPVEVVKTSVKTETKQVNVLYWWQKILMIIGIGAFIACVVLVYKKMLK